MGVDLPNLPECVAAGDVLIRDDGHISLVITGVKGRRVVCTVRMGGRLSDRKGLNRLGGGLSAPSLTARDRAEIAHAAELGFDYVAVSFPLSAGDIATARTLVEATGSEARIIAKVERAEVFDVASAVLDGTDAVMLSAETASGEHPVETVRAVVSTCRGDEACPDLHRSQHCMDRAFKRLDETIAMAAVYDANHLERVAGMVCLTESGATALRMSRLSSGLPIYALSRHPAIVRRMCLYRGVCPLLFDYTACPAGEVVQEAVSELQRLGLVSTGERLILTRGDLLGVGGSTKTLKITEV